MTSEEYTEHLDGIIRSLEHSLGKGSLVRLGSKAERMEVVPTGVLTIDRATGIGGIPRGRITEIYGPESSGKSTLSLHILAEGQRLGLTGAYIDAEHAIEPQYASAIGVQMDSLLLSQPDSGEQALEIVEALVRTGQVSCIVIDSVASLVPSAELEGQMGQSFVGLQARLMSQALRKLTAVTSKSNCALIFLNQLREKVGISWGNPEITPGGRALKFYASLRIDMRRIATEEDAIKCKIKIVKNKTAPPYREVEATLRFGKGFDTLESLVQVGITEGLILKSGAWLNFEDSKFQGVNALKHHLNESPEARLRLETQLAT